MLFFLAPPKTNDLAGPGVWMDKYVFECRGRNPYSKSTWDNVFPGRCCILKMVSVRLPERLIDDVDQLVKAGMYHNRGDAIRAAVRDLLKRELWRTDQG